MWDKICRIYTKTCGSIKKIQKIVILFTIYYKELVVTFAATTHSLYFPQQLTLIIFTRYARSIKIEPL